MWSFGMACAPTEQAFAGGWFHSGDLAVTHEDGYMKIKDRAKGETPAVVIAPLPRTSTGKVQKFILRKRVKSVEAIV